MHIIVLIAICLTISLILSELFYRLNYPRVIGQIIAGIVLGIPVLNEWLTGSSIENIEFLSQLGIVFLLLLAGLEINIKKFQRSSKDSFLIAFMTSIVSFLFGFFMVKAIAGTTLLDLGSYKVNIVAAIVGASLALTAEGTTLNVLIETKTLNTKLGTIILGAGIIDDIFEILFLGLLLIYVNKTMIYIGYVPLLILSFVILTYIVIKFIPKVIRFIQHEHSRVATVSTFIVITLAISAISQLMGIGPVIGAFIAGLIIQWANKDKHDEKEDVKELSIMAFSFIVPFFFINIGLHFDFAIILNDPLLVLLVVLVGTAGKLLGSLMVLPFSSLKGKQAMLVGWGMNARGAMELVIIEIARINNLIPVELYSAVIIMAVTTTLFFPFILKRMLVKNPGIMDDPVKKRENKRPPLTIEDRKNNIFVMDMKQKKDYNF